MTNWHVIAGILSTVPKGRTIGEVAKVTLQGLDGRTKAGPRTHSSPRHRHAIRTFDFFESNGII